MSAREDARPLPARSTYRWSTLALAATAGAALGVIVAVAGAPSTTPLFEVRMPWNGGEPRANEWPGAPGPGERARLVAGEGGALLVVEAPRAPRARELAGALRAHRDLGVANLAEAAATARARWVARLTPEPLPALSPGAECAAWLLAAARRERDLARALPAPWSAAPQAEPLAAPVAVLERLQDVELAAAAADPHAVSTSLVAAAHASDAWFASGVPSPGASPRERGSAWRRWTLDRADSLDARATRLLANETPLQGELAVAAANAFVVGYADALGPGYDALVRGRAASTTSLPSPSPLPGPWSKLLGIGAALGALVALLAATCGLWLRRRVGAESLSLLPMRDPSDADAWLHVVSGANAAATTRALLELAAHALARGERVLVVDGARRLRLHERLGREARWGLMECLLADMPVLGLVQYGGRPGFYLLAHGSTGRGEGWARLGQRLDDVRPHFGRILLAVDPQAPRAIGDSLTGRALEGWWADAPGRLPRAVEEISARLGIAFSGMDLSVMPETTLEALSGRIRALAPLSPEVPPVVVASATPTSVPVPAADLSAPIVLDCDLQVLQRLRFLAWMRRVQLESRASEAVTALS